MYLGVAIVSVVLFGGNGMSPVTLTRMAATNGAFRAGLWAAWLVAATPAARAVLGTPSTFFLRALPIPRWRFFVVQGGLLAVTELPWMVLWTRGAGPIAGIAAALAAVAAHCFIVAPPRRAVEAAFAAALASAIVLGASAPLLGAVAAAIVWSGLRAAWVRAPELGRARDADMIAGPAPVALALAYLATLRRKHAALLLRAAFFVAVATTAFTFSASNDGLRDPGALSVLSLTIFAPAITLGAAGIAGPVWRSERDARWLLDVCGARPLVRVAASLGAPMVVGAVLGVAHGAIASAFLPVAWPVAARLAIEAALAGAALAAAASRAIRWASRGDGRDAARAVVAIFAVVVVAVVAIRAVHALSTLSPFSPRQERAR